MFFTFVFKPTINAKAESLMFELRKILKLSFTSKNCELVVLGPKHVSKPPLTVKINHFDRKELSIIFCDIFIL